MSKKCEIYAKHNIDDEKKTFVGIILNHTMMSNWLKTLGRPECIYELVKNDNLHSLWCWKEKTEVWGRMPTPNKNKKKNIIVSKDDEQPISKDKESRREQRKQKIKTHEKGRKLL